MSLTAKFDFLFYHEIYDEERRRAHLDPRPAVYSWYRNLSVPREFRDNAERLGAWIEKVLAASLSAEFSGKVGPLYKVTAFERPEPLSEDKRELLMSVLAQPAGRAYICQLFESITFEMGPLYVGKARSLVQRIGQHIDGQSDLRALLSAAGISIERCILRYRYVDDGEWEECLAGCAEEAGSPEQLDAGAFLVEELLSKLAPAAFVRRHG